MGKNCSRDISGKQPHGKWGGLKAISLIETYDPSLFFNLHMASVRIYDFLWKHWMMDGWMRQ